jgi:hypothetical protein
MQLVSPIYAVSGAGRTFIGRMFPRRPHSQTSGLRTKPGSRAGEALQRWEIDASVSRDSQSQPTPSQSHTHANRWLVAFHLDHEIREFMRTVEQDLVRHLGRNTNDIAG